ncbi:MAG: nucleoside recognition domain-containing protein [Thermodesulfobacteriota bacterium]
MALNYIWTGFFLVAFIVALARFFIAGDYEIFSRLVNATFEMSKTGFEISLGLTGVLTLWLGIMKIGEKGGAVRILSWLVGPFFRRLFPELPKDHPAAGSIMMNVAANMLGLDNAATPVGLKAMKEMQEDNPDKETATNAMIMFLVLNTSGLTLIPISVMVYRAQLGAVNPTDVFIPILIATFFSTLAGLISVALYQRINLFDRVILAYVGGATALIVLPVVYLTTLPQEKIQLYSSVAGNLILFGIIIAFLTLAAWRRVNVYEAFIDGARDGFTTAVKIIPYLIAILVAIGVFRASGAMDFLVDGICRLLNLMRLNTDFAEALPTALMKPLSGSGSRGLMVDVMTARGADSFVGRVASVVQGSTDTTFYILAVYFGSVGIKNTRYALTCGLIADCVGITAAILLGYIFFY